MIENPSNLTQQLLNLVERVAVEIRAIYNKLKTAAFKVNGITPDAEGNISITSVASATKATQDGNGNTISSTYLTKDSAANIYAAKTDVDSYVNNKAPISHASAETTYGSGTSTAYGHVKLSDSTTSTASTTGGTAATPKAVSTVNTKAVEAYNLASEAKSIAAAALPATGKAASAAEADIAIHADSATKATQDGSGKVIADTYAKKTELSAKAPMDHASTNSSYGTGSDSKFGHVKLSNAVNASNGVSDGIAATPAAVKSAYDLATSANTNASTALSKANNAIQTVNGKAPVNGNLEIDLPSAVHVGNNAPTNSNVGVWVDLDEGQTAIPITSINGFTADANGNINIDTSGGDGSGYLLPAATSTVLGGVKIGSNITNSSGTISITAENVAGALGYYPPQSAPVKSVDGLTGDIELANIYQAKGNYVKTINNTAPDENGNISPEFLGGVTTVQGISGRVMLDFVSNGNAINVKATPTNNSTYSYTVTADGLCNVSVVCTRGRTCNNTATNGEEDPNWVCTPAGKTRMWVKFNGTYLYPNTEGYGQSWSASNMVVKKGDVFEIFCYRQYGSDSDHSFTLQMSPMMIIATAV